jgi:N-carbamoyl-L-amino-acid hydrolase
VRIDDTVSASTGSSADLRIDGERLWRSLLEMAEVGGTPEGGCDRVALTDADKAGHELLARWASDAGCRVSRDRIGNLFAERAGADPEAPQVLVGSHLDTQPNGGRFDGAYGVLAGLEIVRTLNDRAVRTSVPIVVVSWVNEEGARFPLATTGSAVFSGVLSLEQALGQSALDGPSFAEEITRLGLSGDEEVGARRVAAYFEGHIEQGPRLESAGAVIGLVSGGQALRALSVELRGRESHAGTTPMDGRRDALLGAARIISDANQLTRRFEGGLVTVGQLSVEPNSRSVVPGRVSMTIDLRHVDAQVVESMEAEARRDVESSTFLRIDPVAFDESCTSSIRQASARLGLPSLELVSGAVHDAMNVARAVPAALMFVPCRDGISHHPDEYCAPEHARAGCDVLLHAVLDRAGVAAIG